MNLSQVTHRARPVVRRAGAFIKQELDKVGKEDIVVKDFNSLVSYVDKTAERMLVEGLREVLPDATYLTEEETVANSDSEWRWVIDPLDGTTNFLYGLPHFAVSVALEHYDEYVIGIVYDPMRDEMFVAWQGGGAYLNDKPIHTSSQVELRQTLLATGFPYHDFSRMRHYLQVFEYLMQHSRGLRRQGAAALDLAYVACGRYDAYFEYALQPWDLAAGVVLVREAGGRVTDFDGGTRYRSGAEIIAAGEGIYEPLRDVMQSHF